MFNGLRELAERVRSAPERVRLATAIGKQTGLMWALTPPGIAELVRVLASGSQNPSLIYRVHARNTPDKAAIIWHGDITTWAELDDRVDRFASGLKRRGIGRRQSIIAMLRNRPELIEIPARRRGPAQRRSRFRGDRRRRSSNTSRIIRARRASSSRRICSRSSSR